MSVNLELFVLQPADLRRSKIYTVPRTKLFVPQDYDVLHQVGGCEGYFQNYPAPVVKVRKLPVTMEVEVEGKDYLLDRFDCPLKVSFAGEFKKVKLPERICQEIKAIFAYLAILDPQTPILVWWR